MEMIIGLNQVCERHYNQLLEDNCFLDAEQLPQI